MSGHAPVRPPDAAEARRFGLLVGAVLVGIAILFWFRGRLTMTIAFAAIGTVLVVGGVLLPKGLVPVYRLWMGLAHLLSKVTTPLFMGLVYFVVLTPTGLLRRAFGGNPLVVKEGAEGFWVTVPPPKSGGMERQF